MRLEEIPDWIIYVIIAIGICIWAIIPAIAGHILGKTHFKEDMKRAGYENYIIDNTI